VYIGSVFALWECFLFIFLGYFKIEFSRKRITRRTKEESGQSEKRKGKQWRDGGNCVRIGILQVGDGYQSNEETQLVAIV